MFAVEHEAVIPDIMVLGKGLSGGYLPLAITLVSEKIFSAFDGSVVDGKALAYGHSYTGNALGCAAAKASLEIFRTENVLAALQPKIQHLSEGLASLRQLPGVVEVRQCGFIAGIELDESHEDGLSATRRDGPGFAAAVCIEARQHGLLTRPIRNVVVLMPPLCITTDQLTQAVKALRASIITVWDCRSGGPRPASCDADPGPLDGEAAATQGHRALLVAVANRSPVGVVLAFGAGQRRDRLLHQGLHDLQSGANRQRQQASVAEWAISASATVTSLGMVSPSVLASTSLVWYCLPMAVPFLVVFLADHPRPTRRQGSGGGPPPQDRREPGQPPGRW